MEINTHKSIAGISKLRELKKSLCGSLGSYIGDRSKDIYFSKIFAKWIFTANMHGSIKYYYPVSYDCLKQSVNDDLRFLLTSGKIINDDPKIGDVPYNFHDIDIERVSCDILSRNSELNGVSSVVFSYRKTHNKIVIHCLGPEPRQCDYGCATISILQFYRLEKLYHRHNATNFDSCKAERRSDQAFLGLCFVVIWCYNIIGGLSNHLSVPSKIIRKFNIDEELFASPLNCCVDYYSAFPDMEKFFGSKGNFFSDFVALPNKIYLVNPPFDSKIINNATSIINNSLDHTENITFIIIVPVWDRATRKKLEMELFQEDDYDRCLEELLQNRYLKDSSILELDKAVFYNFFNNSYTTPTPIHIILVSNNISGISSKDVKKYWEELDFPLKRKS